MAIKITSDSTCDLSPELLERYNISLLPLAVTLGEQVYHDGVDICPQNIFDHVTKTGQLPITAAINIVEYIDFFTPFLKEYDAVIHINIGSGFSSCHQNACLAAAELEHVYPVDSENLSTGQGFIVLEAAAAAQRGESVESILARLEDLKPRVDTSFVVDKLDYLAKGGRCSSAAALGANLLNLKPCILLAEGKMGVGKKYRGQWAKVLPGYARDRLAGKDIDKKRVFITSTSCTPEIQSELHVLLEAEGFEEILETTAGCTVTSHCGPNTLGVLFIRK
ncbi:MAG: DegV family protein [Oscillospiraceae bacterium]|nr:DegV family protein [Oscillospiraceae bacterium]